MSLPGLFRVMAALLLLQEGRPVFADDCFFRGDGPNARVARRSGELLRPFPLTLSDSRCETLRVSTGTVTVYFKQEEDAPLVKRRVSEGPLLPSEKAPSVVTANGHVTPEGKSSAIAELVRTFRNVLAGDQVQRTGSSRSDADDYLVNALPVGRMAKPAHNVVIPLGREGDPRLERFELRIDGRLVFALSGPASELQIPSAAFPGGATAHWTLRYGGVDATGQVIIDSGREMEDIRRRLEQENAAETDDTLRSLQIAAGFLRAGYAWDARPFMWTALGVGPK
jgi:hypothetical protein